MVVFVHLERVGAVWCFRAGGAGEANLGTAASGHVSCARPEVDRISLAS